MGSKVAVNWRKTEFDFSTSVTCRAPRERASKLSIPLPEYSSRQFASNTSLCSQLKRVSRTRSGVGRTSPVSEKDILRLRHFPPIILNDDIMRLLVSIKEP